MNKKGQNLIEVLIALAIFFIFITGSLVLAFRYLDTFSKARDLREVQFITEESFEAIQSIAYNNWSLIINGAYGLNSSTGSWQLQADPDLIDNKYTRTISISSIERDVDCEIVASGGAEDPDTKLITVAIDWQIPGSPQSQSFSQYITSWDNPTTCLAEGEAGQLLIDVSTAIIDTTKKSLTGVKLINMGSIPITLDKMALTWTEPGNITFIKIEGTNYWHSSSGIGSPQGVQPSGTELDLVDLILEPGVDYKINSFRFDSKVDGSTFTITIMMSDGSSTTEVTTPPFIP